MVMLSPPPPPPQVIGSELTGLAAFGRLLVWIVTWGVSNGE